MISTSTRRATVMKTLATVCSSPLRGGLPTPAAAPPCLGGTVINHNVNVLDMEGGGEWKPTLLLLSECSENRLGRGRNAFVASSRRNAQKLTYRSEHGEGESANPKRYVNSFHPNPLLCFLRLLPLPLWPRRDLLSGVLLIGRPSAVQGNKLRLVYDRFTDWTRGVIGTRFHPL